MEGRGCRRGQKTGDKNKAPQRSLWTMLSHFPHHPLRRDDCQLYFIDRNIITDRENDRPKSHGRVYVPTSAGEGEGGALTEIWGKHQSRPPQGHWLLSSQTAHHSGKMSH